MLSCLNVSGNADGANGHQQARQSPHVKSGGVTGFPGESTWLSRKRCYRPRTSFGINYAVTGSAGKVTP